MLLYWCGCCDIPYWLLMVMLHLVYAANTQVDSIGKFVNGTKTYKSVFCIAVLEGGAGWVRSYLILVDFMKVFYRLDIVLSCSLVLSHTSPSSCCALLCFIVLQWSHDLRHACPYTCPRPTRVRFQSLLYTSRTIQSLALLSFFFFLLT